MEKNLLKNPLLEIWMKIQNESSHDIFEMLINSCVIMRNAFDYEMGLNVVTSMKWLFSPNQIPINYQVAPNRCLHISEACENFVFQCAAKVCVLLLTYHNFPSEMFHELIENQ